MSTQRAMQTKWCSWEILWSDQQEAYVDCVPASPEQVTRVQWEVAHNLALVLDTRVQWEFNNQGWWDMEWLKSFEHALIASPILLELVTKLIEYEPFQEKTTNFRAYSQVDALLNQSGYVEIDTKQWTYSLIEEWWQIYFLNGSIKIVMMSPTPATILAMIDAIEQPPWWVGKRIFQTITAAKISHLGISEGSTTRSLRYNTSRKEDEWTKEETKRKHDYYTLTLGKVDYFIGEEDDGRIYLRDLNGKRVSFFDDEQLCIAYLRKISPQLSWIALQQAIQTFEDRHELRFESNIRPISTAVRDREKNRDAYIKAMGDILDHVRTYTEYLGLLNQNESVNSMKIAETITHISVLYLALFHFYNPWKSGKKRIDSNYLDGLAKRLYRLHRLQESERSWNKKLRLVISIAKQLQAHISIFRRSTHTPEPDNLPAIPIEPRQLSDAIDTSWEWLLLIMHRPVSVATVDTFNQFLTDISPFPLRIDIGRVDQIIRVLSMHHHHMKTEYLRLMEGRWAQLQTTLQSSIWQETITEDNDSSYEDWSSQVHWWWI